PHDTERKQRGYIFAKHYYKINEFESAEQYLSSFLTVDTENSAALKLMGQICLKLNKQDKALASFQKSLQLNPKQPDLITEVCQLLLADNNLNPSTANYWCNFAENEKVQNDAVFGLRLKIMENGLHESSNIFCLVNITFPPRPVFSHMYPIDYPLRGKPQTQNHVRDSKILCKGPR
uniref:Uncharacterized protein n=1 Tax=Megaselia scalaris TaxID=36166 RepID=T1GN14_MEGSC